VNFHFTSDENKKHSSIAPMVVASFAFFLYKSKDRTNSGTMFTKKPNLSAPKKNEIENEPFHTK
jgi:hypothetical protein